MNKDNVYIENIFDSIGKIEDFLRGIDEKDFLENQMMQSATIMQLVVIGEESNKISDNTKSKIDLPWREIVGFRNMAVHEYMNLGLDIVWKTTKESLPQLKSKLLEYKKTA